ncbi:MAG: hypothetical protein AAGA30_19125, partial [Planctomycetota bacterium]
MNKNILWWNRVLVLGVGLGLLFGTQVSAQTTTWIGIFNNNEWNHTKDGLTNWDGPFNGSSIDAVIDLPPGTNEYTVVLNDALIGASDLVINLNSLTVGPNASLQIADTLDFTGSAQTTLTNHGLIFVRDQNGSHLLRLVGNVLNTGTMIADHDVFANSNWFVVSAAGATLQGGGVTELAGNLGAQITGPVGAVLQIEDQIIEGRGEFGTNTLQILNGPMGIIRASTGTFIVDAGTAGMTNSGMMSADGGTLVIEDSDLDNSGGTIQAELGSEVQFRSTELVGGEVTGDGIIRISSNSTFRNVTNTSNLLTIPNTQDLQIAETLTNISDISISDSQGGDATIEVLAEGALINGGGTITMSGNTPMITGVAGAVLVLEDQTINGSGTVGGDSIG